MGEKKMKVRDLSLAILAGLFVLGALGYGVAKITKKEDSPTEELIESVIESQTGLDIDLSPDSPEDE